MCEIHVVVVSVTTGKFPIRLRDLLPELIIIINFADKITEPNNGQHLHNEDDVANGSYQELASVHGRPLVAPRHTRNIAPLKATASWLRPLDKNYVLVRISKPHVVGGNTHLCVSGA